MRNCNALGSLTCLRPQDRLAVLSQPVCRIVSNSIDTSGHALQPATLRQPNQHGILDSQRAHFFGRQQAVMLFGKCI